MKFVGHTMGTPEMDVCQAIDLYAQIGMDAIEIVAQEGGKFWIDAPDALVEQVMEAAKKLPDGVITLTPYYWHINNSDEQLRRENIEGMKRAVRLAKRMGAKFVRAYGGTDNAGGTMEENWVRSVEALKEIAPVAEECGITVIVENHPGTMTRTGEATAKLIAEVASPNVRALYDAANVMHDTDEPWEHTFETQKDIIAYVHVKDYYMEDRLYNQSGWRLGNTFVLDLEDTQTDEGITAVAALNASAKASKISGFTADTTNIQLEMTNCQSVVSEYYDLLNEGLTPDTDKVIDEMNAKLEQAGVQTIIDELQSQIDAWLAAK